MLDDDGSGTLELNELKAHLRGLMDAAQAAMARTTKVEENVQVMRRRARQAQQVLEAIEEAERKEAQLNELRAQQPLVVRLGGLLKSMTNPAAMMRTWDTNGDGVLSKIEFRQQVRKLNIGADYHETDALFASLDEDGSGERHSAGTAHTCDWHRGLHM